MSRYQNCFYYFRGPRDVSREERAAKQLEDNTTKALINVLEHGGPEITASFLEEVADCPVKQGTKDAEFFLQAGPKKASKRKLLLGLAVLDEIDPKSWSVGDGNGGSRIDAAIHLPGQLTVFLETKVVEQLDGAQMNRHAREWKLAQATETGPANELPDGWKLITWTDVDRWARGVASKKLDPVAAFLLDQLIEFLGFAGLSVSWVFEEQHFELFEKDPKDRDDEVRAEIRARLSSIWERIKESIGPEAFEQKLGEIRVGNLGNTADHGWAQTHAEKDSTHLNLTIEISSTEAMVNLVGWFDGQLSKARLLMTTDRFEKFVKKNPEYELVIFKRMGHPSQKSTKVVWQGAKHKLIERVPFRGNSAGELLAKVNAFEDGLDSRLEKASIHIRRSWSREQAVGNSSLPTEMAIEVEKLQPLLEKPA